MSDCFHDGEKTLPMVYEMHDELAQYFRHCDHITGEALRLMINEMLDKEDGRPLARQLYLKSERILSHAETMLRKSAAKRYPGETRPARSPQHTMDDRPKTPPQTPRDLLHYQPLTPRRHDTAPSERTSSPESMAYVGVDKHRLMHNFDSPTRRVSRRADHPGRIGGVNLYLQSNGDNESDRPHPVPGPPSTPKSLGWRQSFSETSRNHRQDASSANDRQNNDGASFVTTPRSAGHVDLRHSIECRNGTHDQLQASPTEAPWDRKGTGSRDAPHRLQDSQYARNNAMTAQTEDLGFEQTHAEVSHATPDSPKRSPPPYLKLADAKRWKLEKKNGTKPTLSHASLLEDLDERDHVRCNLYLSNLGSWDYQVFLVDNSKSMGPHRREVNELFGLLAYMVKEKDHDGIELHTTISNKRERSKDTSPLSKSLLRKTYDGTSNIRLALSKILGPYEAKLRGTWHSKPRKQPQVVKGLNIYIFTDGVWQPDSDPTELIRDIVEILKEHRIYREHFGIQFIHFGNNQEGIDRLNRLDSGLNLSM